MQPKYKVHRVIETIHEKQKQVELLKKRARSEKKKLAYAASITTMDWMVQVLRAEIR